MIEESNMLGDLPGKAGCGSASLTASWFPGCMTIWMPSGMSFMSSARA